MIIKKLPGAEPVYMVYDKRDQLVAVPDGNSLANATNAVWVYSKYDCLNRPVVIGIWKTSTTHQNMITTATNWNEPLFESKTGADAAGSDETVTNTFDFSGKILSSQQKQTVNGITTTILKTPAYDHAGRLLKTDLKLNNEPVKTISALKYNKLG